MASRISCILGAFAMLLAATGDGAGQDGGGEGWDSPATSFGRAREAAPNGRNAPLETLNKILSASQLSAIDRSLYLSIRAFQLSKVGREADSQKDVAEMGKLLPNVWQLVLSSTQPELAGGGDRAAALRTLDYGLKRKPGDPWLLIAQAQVNMQLADFPLALGLLDNAVASASSESERRTAFYFRGLANFNLGNFQAAADDFAASLVGRTTLRARIAPLLWRYASLAATRQDARATLVREIGQEPLTGWPAPIASFLLGRITPGELELAAESDDAAKQANGKCPAAFFTGMEALRRGDRQRAREQFQLAQARCPTVSEINWAAASELKRL
jgi:tetratricopeptide (TPR) repeat protein